MCYTYTVEYYSGGNNVVCREMDGLEITILNEISQTQTNIVYFLPNAESRPKKNDMNVNGDCCGEGASGKGGGNREGGGGEEYD
jgi:hypothetical protein